MGGSSSKNDSKSVNPYSKSPQPLQDNKNTQQIINEDEFYDGIPRFSSQKSKSTRVPKVAEVSSRLGSGKCWIYKDRASIGHHWEQLDQFEFKQWICFWCNN